MRLRYRQIPVGDFLFFGGETSGLGKEFLRFTIIARVQGQHTHFFLSLRGVHHFEHALESAPGIATTHL